MSANIAVKSKNAMFERAAELFWICVCAVLIGFVALIVVGSCAALAPVRWLIDWDAKRQAEGDKWTS